MVVVGLEVLPVSVPEAVVWVEALVQVHTLVLTGFSVHFDLHGLPSSGHHLIDLNLLLDEGFFVVT
jgi:hypothetical protein